MESQSYWEASRFVFTHLDKAKPLNILDVGAYDINGTTKPLFDSPNWKYTGLDIEAGPNVDIVSADPYSWPCKNGEYDVVISVSTLEHVEDIYAWADEAIRVLKPDGYLCVTAPFNWVIHYKIDCWRFCPDGFRFLFIKRGKLIEKEIYLSGDICVIVATK